MKISTWILLALGASMRVTAGCDLQCSIEQQLREQQLAGAVYSVVDGDHTRTGATGFADHQSRQPMRADSKVHIGSVAKTLLALGVLRLASQGRVDLDAPLAELLPGTPIYNPWHARTPVTLRHVLDHSSGLEDLRLWHLFTLEVDPRAPLSGAFTRAPEILRVRVEPGTHFSYSNMGFTLAGMVIEAVTRERYEAWLERELLGPLGMADSTFEFVSQTGANADPRLAWGHFDDFSRAAASAVWMRPATQFTTTAADMTRMMRLLMDEGRIDGSPFIDESLMRQMGRGRLPANAAGLEVGYALGLLKRDRHGAVGLCHTGNVVGYRAAFCVFREQRKAFFIAHNSDSETANYDRFDGILTDSLGVQSPVTPAPRQAAAPVEWQGRYLAAPARFETFRYFDFMLDSVRVDATAAGLTLHRMDREPQELVAVGPNTYRAADRTMASHVLMRDEGQTVIGEGTRTMRRIGAVAFTVTWISLALGLAGIVGLLLLIPWRAWRSGETLVQPASLTLVLLIVPVPLFAMQSFMAMGDVTAASVAVYVATIALPVGMLAQVIWAWRKRAKLASWRVHALLAVMVLQWCGSLYVWDLLPFALWS